MASDSLHDPEWQLRRSCADLDRRLRAGERGVADQLLSTSGQSLNDEAAIELIYTELVTLEELGERPSLETWQQKYPHWSERLARLWKLHEAFEESDGAAAKNVTLHGHSSQQSTSPSGQSAAPSFPEITLGRWLGKYELLEEIDRGGMGIVYRARQQGLNRIVAIKSVRSAAASDNDRARFRIEAEAAGKLEHPNIVRVYEVGEQDGCDYFSMEFIEGGSLHRRLKETRISPRVAAELVAILADAVQFAHDHGIVHRDLKPGNVLIAGGWPPSANESAFRPITAPTVKITDFGLAKCFRENTKFQTQSGVILGTPSYMSPEQADGRLSAIGPATDIYSLGAILYELLTGQPPFDAATPIETLQAIRTREPVPPDRIEPQIPKDLATICLKCLEKEPQRRYVAARDLADDLRRFLEHRPILARPISLAERAWRLARRHRGITGLAAALLLLSVISAAVLMRQHRRVGELATLAASTSRVAAEHEQRATAADAEAEARFKQSRALVEQWTRLGEQLNRPGMDELRRQALEQALAFYSQFLSEHGDDPQLRLATARAAMRAGVLQAELGSWEPSEKNLRLALSLFRSLPPDEPIHLDHESTLLHLAHVERRLERWADSEATYQAAIALGKELVAKYPGNDAHAIALSNALTNLCVVLNRDRRYEDSERTYCHAIRLLRSMIERRMSGEPDNSSLTELVHTVDEQSVSPGDEIVASRELRARLFHSPQPLLVKISSGNYLSELALCLDDLGGLLFRRGKTEEAHHAYLEALEFRQLTQNHLPRETWRGSYIARSYTHLGEVEERLEHFDVALERFQKSAEILGQLHKDAPARLEYRLDLAYAYGNLARVHRRLERYADAAHHHRQAITLQEQLVASNPSTNSYRRDLANNLDGLGRALAALEKGEEAIQAYERSVQVDPTYYASYNNWAWLLLISPNRSLRDSAKALELARQALERNSNSRAVWHTVGTAQFRQGLLDEAEKSLRKSMELSNGGSAHDWFYLAAIQAQRGNLQEARSWFDRAKAWSESQLPRDGELRLIQEEATLIVVGRAE